MSDDTDIIYADSESSNEVVNNEFHTDFQRSDWSHQPQVLGDRADVQYTDGGWKSIINRAAGAPELNPCSARTTFYPHDIQSGAQFDIEKAISSEIDSRCSMNCGSSSGIGDRTRLKTKISSVKKHGYSTVIRCYSSVRYTGGLDDSLSNKFGFRTSGATTATIRVQMGLVSGSQHTGCTPTSRKQSTHTWHVALLTCFLDWTRVVSTT